jgi:phytoene synthase
MYLPLGWLREAGIDASQWLARPVHTPTLGSVVQRLLREADALYARVDAGVAGLPLACRPGINAARFLYAQIGLEVERRGLNAVDARAVVSRRRKALGVLRALLTLAPRRTAAALPPLVATTFLVDAVARSSPVVWPAATPRAAWWNLVQRAVGVVELFERLERDERRQRGVRAAYPS